MISYGSCSYCIGNKDGIGNIDKMIVFIREGGHPRHRRYGDPNSDISRCMLNTKGYNDQGPSHK